MSTPSSVNVTPGSGVKKIATYEIDESTETRDLSRVVLNDADGAELKGAKPRAQSVPTAWSTEDLAALQAGDPVPGVVDIPSSSESPLATATRGIVVTLAGNLGAKFVDGSDNNTKLIPVTSGQVLPFRVTQLTAANTAGVLGLK